MNGTKEDTERTRYILAIDSLRAPLLYTMHIISNITQQNTRRDSVPYAALYIAPILIDTRLHSTRGQFFIRQECGVCIRLRTNTSLIRMISRSAYGFGIFVITCLHTSDERVQTLYTSCIRIVSNSFSVLHT